MRINKTNANIFSFLNYFTYIYHVVSCHSSHILAFCPNNLVIIYESSIYIKCNAKYKDVPVIIMGVSMGGAVAIRSIGENKDIYALVSLSAFSSLEETSFIPCVRLCCL